MDIEVLKQARKIVTGTKQTTKAVTNEEAQHVFVARDAAEHIVKPVLEACKERNIPVTFVDTMEELGQACGIKVKAAMSAIIEMD
ncbi:MAG: 50S ribosomal protein L7ae-like protein [Firmicutes bacterium]|nr:50S ribosomal protein L7ae-like protein [Bacillota bacterium]